MGKVFVAGNPLLKEDSLALRVASKLEGKVEGVQFEEITSLSELEKIPMELWLLDVARGIGKVERINDLGKLRSGGGVSLHDFDLGTELLLYRKLGKLGRVVVIAIPANYETGKAVKEVIQMIKNMG